MMYKSLSKYFTDVKKVIKLSNKTQNYQFFVYKLSFSMTNTNLSKNSLFPKIALYSFMTHKTSCRKQTKEAHYNFQNATPCKKNKFARHPMPQISK